MNAEKIEAARLAFIVIARENGLDPIAEENAILSSFEVDKLPKHAQAVVAIDGSGPSVEYYEWLKKNTLEGLNP